MAPASIAVVGASRKPGRGGHAILRNIGPGGFGEVWGARDELLQRDEYGGAGAKK